MNQKGLANSILVLFIVVFVGVSGCSVLTQNGATPPLPSIQRPTPQSTPIPLTTGGSTSTPVETKPSLPPISEKVSPNVLKELEEKGSASIIVQTRSGQAEIALATLSADEFQLGRILYDYPKQFLAAFSGKATAGSALEKLSQNDAVIGVQLDTLSAAQ